MFALRMAWRGVLRGRRRTSLTAASVAFGVVVIVVHLALNAGNHEKIIEDSVRVQSGHVAVSGEGFRTQRTLEHFVRFDAELEERLLEVDGVKRVAPRLIGAGLISADDRAVPAALLGVDPGRERSLSSLASLVSEGRFVSSEERGTVVLGGRLARHLAARIGDTVLLYSVAYTLRPAYELFEVVGILELPSASQDRRLAIVHLDDAQTFFEYDDRISEIAVLATDASWTDRVADALRSLPWTGDSGSVEVLPWYELSPSLVRMMTLDNNGMYLLLGILMLVVGLGILNAVLMSVLERDREFKVVRAIGISRRDLAATVVIECLLQCGLGLLVGFAIAIPGVLWLHAHPMPVSGEAAEMMRFLGAEPVYAWKLEAGHLLVSVSVVGVMALAAAVLPALKAARSNPASAVGRL